MNAIFAVFAVWLLAIGVGLVHKLGLLPGLVILGCMIALGAFVIDGIGIKLLFLRAFGVKVHNRDDR